MSRKQEKVKNGKQEQMSFRLREPLSTRFHEVVQASRRTKTSVIEECLELVLPQLEKQYRHGQDELKNAGP